MSQKWIWKCFAIEIFWIINTLKCYAPLLANSSSCRLGIIFKEQKRKSPKSLVHWRACSLNSMIPISIIKKSFAQGVRNQSHSFSLYSIKSQGSFQFNFGAETSPALYWKSDTAGHGSIGRFLRPESVVSELLVLEI